VQLKACDRALATNNLDAAESLVDTLLRKVKAAADDAESEYDDPSDTSLENDEDPDLDDDEELEKAAHEHAGGSSEFRMRGQHVAVNRPDTYRIKATPEPEGPGKLHRFESRWRKIRDDNPGMSRTSAMSEARRTFPETYTDYIDHLSRRSTTSQARTRNYARSYINKSSAGTTTWEDLVSEQAAAGCSYELAKTRVINLHGYPALQNRTFAKGAESVQRRFEDEIYKIYDANGSCTLEEATRQARLAIPSYGRARGRLGLPSREAYSIGKIGDRARA
jgi:hypothetical protein